MADATLDDDEAPKEGEDAPKEGEEGAEGEDGEEGAEGEGDGGKKKKIIIIAAAALLLLVGGGAGLYFTGMLDSLLGKEAHGEAGADGEHGAAEGEDGEAAVDSHGNPVVSGGPVFLKIPDMIVNLSGTGAQPRYLRLSVQLELKSEGDMQGVEQVMPRVVDQFQTYLRELRVKDLRGSAGIYRLQMELLSRVNAASYPIEVQDVLFQEILIQ